MLKTVFFAIVLFTALRSTEELTFLKTIKGNINLLCAHLEPWEIIIYSTIVTFVTIWCVDFLHVPGDQSLVQRVLRFSRRVPIIQRNVEKKMNAVNNEVEKQLRKGLENKTYLQRLPTSGWSKEEILNVLEEYQSYGEYTWNDGHVSGAVYHGNDENLHNLMKEIYGQTAYTNPLHPDIFPGIRIMEAEVIRMICSLFNGDEESCGTVTSGGTESIFLACKAYRDYARMEKGIKHPNMVIPVTAHAAFDKAAHVLQIEVKHVPIDPATTKVDVVMMKRAINKNTCMLVGSTPPFPHGSIDPIMKIAELGQKFDIPVHVDACLGGFLVPFMNRAGYTISPFDFSVPGVCSISADTHKYAFAPKGSSVIMYRDKKYRHYQFSVQPNWPGGIYGTPNFTGSRAGGIIATCWASLLYHGEETYIETTKKIIGVAKYIEHGLRNIPGIYVFGQPDVSVIAVGSHDFDIYRLSGSLTQKGWNLNVLQFPSGFHFCVTLQHTEEKVADIFLDDVRECTSEIMKDPKLPAEGAAAIYGMAQQIPDRSLVSEIVWAFLDACYSSKNKKADS